MQKAFRTTYSLKNAAIKNYFKLDDGAHSESESENTEQYRYCGDGLHRIEGGKLGGKGPAILIFRSNDATTLAGFKFSFEREYIPIIREKYVLSHSLLLTM